MQTKTHSLLSQRGQMFACEFGFWLLLVFWTISAFWQHIDSLQPKYLFAARVGACSAEFVILVMIFLHCFSKHINVRKWALILGTALAVIAVAHTAGLRGLDEATVKQAETQTRMREELTKMSKEQMEAANGRFKSRTQQEIATQAQKQVADTVKASADVVKDSSIFPRWYLDGWMYGVLFGISAIALAVPLGMMGNRLDVDADFDGMPDHLQKQNEFPSQIDVGK